MEYNSISELEIKIIDLLNDLLRHNSEPGRSISFIIKIKDKPIRFNFTKPLSNSPGKFFVSITGTDQPKGVCRLHTRASFFKALRKTLFKDFN